MNSCLPASWMTPATLALMTAVGPPDWATRRLPTSSAINFSTRSRAEMNIPPRSLTSGSVKVRRNLANRPDNCQRRIQNSRRGGARTADGAVFRHGAGTERMDGWGDGAEWRFDERCALL